MMNTVKEDPIHPGDVVLIEFQPGWTTAAIVGLGDNEFFHMPREYQWAQIESGERGFDRASIDKDQVKFLSVMGLVSLRYLPGYLEWLHTRNTPTGTGR